MINIPAIYLNYDYILASFIDGFRTEINIVFPQIIFRRERFDLYLYIITYISSVGLWNPEIVCHIRSDIVFKLNEVWKTAMKREFDVYKIMRLKYFRHELGIRLCIVFVFYAPRKISGEHLVGALSVCPSVRTHRRVIMWLEGQ
jgi:hypothetical protein